MMYSPFRHIASVFWKRRPIHLTVFLTRRCNAACPFCFYLSRPGQDRPELTSEELEHVAGSLGSLLWLAFSGGEVFLRDDLARIVRSFYVMNRPAIILLSTNGLLPGRIRDVTVEILRKCPKSTVAVKLSLDGPEDVHDAIRQVPGAFRKVIETHRLLAALKGRYKNLELGVNTVYCPENRDGMAETRRIVRELGGRDTHTVTLVRATPYNRLSGEADLAVYRETLLRMEAELESGEAGRYRFWGAGIKAAQDILQRRIILQTALQKRRMIPCYAGRLNLVITETGDVYPCEAFERLLGNVREADYDMGAILRGSKAREAVRSIRSACFCTHECFIMTNILFNPSQYPALLREYARLCFPSGRDRVQSIAP